MKSIKIYVLGLLMMSSIVSLAQSDTLRGIVIDNTNGAGTPLPGAFVHWEENKAGVYANKEGKFELVYRGEKKSLVTSFITYKDDTTGIANLDSFYTVGLISSSQIDGISIIARVKSYGLSRMDPKTTINLSEREFQKAACCNLSESFQNAPAIDVNFSDAVTGTKQIKMLGLDGIYTLFSREYMPAVRTLNSYYGMSFIPASWVKSIQITKGAGSIVNGYESIAGQINIEMKKPFDHDKTLVDQFVSESGRSETDIMKKFDINQHLATSVFAKAAFYPSKMDRNNDGFLDNPTGRQLSFMNRWQFYTKKNMEGQVNASYTSDLKNAGQQQFYNSETPSTYGINIQNQQWDVWAKVGKTNPNKEYQSLGSQFRVNGSSIESRYGNQWNNKTYTANATTFYGNLMLETILKTSLHKVKTGVSFLGDVLTETYDTFNFDRQELVPGAFVEYTYMPKESFSLVGGVRADYNSIYGLLVTPRFHGKYRFNKDKTALRLSAGLGRRTSNILSQNQQIFASSRAIFIEGNGSGAYGLQQESALNSGISFEHEFKISYFPATLFVDYFNTSFINEVVFDREVDSTVRFYNMENSTRSNSFQIQLDMQPYRRTDVRLAYRMFDVTSLYNLAEAEVRLDKPFVSRHRAFVNITQTTRKKWEFTSTLQWYGKQRIPGYASEKLGDQKYNVVANNYSPSFFMLNAQVSKTLKVPLELYIGVENMLNYKQPNAIQGSEAPFDDNFDAGLVWGPVFGRMIYGGFRWRVNIKDEHE